MKKIAANLAAHSDLVADAYIRKRYAILFYSLLLTFVASPLLAALQWKSTFIEILLAATLLIAVLPVRTVSVRWTLWVLIVLALAGRFFSEYLRLYDSHRLILGVMTLVGLLAAVNALRYSLEGHLDPKCDTFTQRSAPICWPACLLAPCIGQLNAPGRVL